MPTLTLAIPDDLKKLIDDHPEFNCSEIARQAIRERLELLDQLDRTLAKSKLTPTDVAQLGKSVNRKMAEHYRQKYG